MMISSPWCLFDIQIQYFEVNTQYYSKPVEVPDTTRQHSSRVSVQRFPPSSTSPHHTLPQPSYFSLSLTFPSLRTPPLPTPNFSPPMNVDSSIWNLQAQTNKPQNTNSPITCLCIKISRIKHLMPLQKHE